MQKSDSNFRSHSVYSCVVSFIPFGTLFRAIAFPWSRKLCHHNKMTLCRCSPINREFYHAKGTEKFILGRYLLSGILLILLSLRPWGVAPPYWRIGVQNHIFAIISLSVRDNSIMQFSTFFVVYVFLSDQ
jgi:hypothetical protein